MSDRSSSRHRVQRWSRRALIVLGVLPIAVGVRVLIGGSARFVSDVAALDHQLRYLGGVYLGIGLAVVWAATRRIPHATILIAAGGAVLIGGLSRLVSIIDVGASSAAQYAALGLELSVLPIVLVLLRPWSATDVETGSRSDHGAA